jgi:hypothetical protein
MGTKDALELAFSNGACFFLLGVIPVILVCLATFVNRGFWMALFVYLGIWSAKFGGALILGRFMGYTLVAAGAACIVAFFLWSAKTFTR